MRNILRRWSLVLLVGLPLIAMPVAMAAPLITAADIADGAVTRNKIAYGAIDGDRIADRSISLKKLSVLTVLSANLGQSSVTTAKLADQAVTTRKLGVGSVRKAKIAAKSINSLKIIDGSIQREDLGTGSVNTHKVADNSLGGRDIRDGSLTGVDLAPSAIGSDRIANSSLTGTDVKDGSLSGADIANGSIDQNEFPLALIADQPGLRIESGETTISTAALGVQLKTVSFTQNFSSAPLVLVSYKDFSNYPGTDVQTLMGNPSVSSIDIQHKVTGSSPGSFATVSWIAIGK